MDSYIALTLFGCFFVLVFIGVPISFSIGIATVASMLLMFPWDIAAITVSQRLANGLDNFALLAIPFSSLPNADEQRRYCDTFD